MTHPHPPTTLALLTQVAPWHNSLRRTHLHPTAYEKEKKNRWWKRWGGPRKEWIRHNSPTHAVLAHLFHPLRSYRDIYAIALDQLSQLDIGAKEMEGLLVMCNRTEVLGVLSTYPAHSPSRSKWTRLFVWQGLPAGMASCSKPIKAFWVVVSSPLAKRMPKKLPSELM